MFLKEKSPCLVLFWKKPPQTLLLWDWLGNRLFSLNDLKSYPPEVYPHLDNGCLDNGRTNLASGVVKQNHLFGLYFKPNSVSYSLIVWIYLALGSSYWKCWNAILTFHFRLITTYTQSRIYLWQVAFSCSKSNGVQCLHLPNNLPHPNERSRGRRGLSTERRTKAWSISSEKEKS